MQCPNCGFQNMPGAENCGICSQPLIIKDRPAENVFPPRASERPLLQRVRLTRRVAAGAAGRVPKVAEAVRRTERALFQLLRPFPVCLISIIPGAGHLLYLKQTQTGVRLLGAAAVLALLSVALITHPLSNLFLFVLVSLSLYSFGSVFQTLYFPYIESARIGRENTLIASWSFSFVGFIAIALILYGLLQIPFDFVTVNQMAVSDGPLKDRDTLLIRRETAHPRGSIVLYRIRNFDEDGNFYNQVNSLGMVVGVPGDKIEITNPNRLNGARLRPRYSQKGPYEHFQLKPGYFWILPLTILNNGQIPANILTQVCIVSESSIQGKAAYIIDPPRRRQRVMPERILE